MSSRQAAQSAQIKNHKSTPEYFKEQEQNSLTLQAMTHQAPPPLPVPGASSSMGTAGMSVLAVAAVPKEMGVKASIAYSDG